MPAAGNAIKLSHFQGKSKFVAAPAILGSTILTTAHQSTMDTMLPGTAKTLLYRASRDGFTASAFHTKCDGIAKIWVVMKSDGNYIATAYSSVAFNSSNGYIPAIADTCWLNNLQSPSGVVSTSRFTNSSFPDNSIGGFVGSGPVFGTGYDLIIVDKFNAANGSSSSPSTYNNSGFTSTILFGVASNFKITEMEIYAITPGPILSSTILNTTHQAAMDTMISSTQTKTLLYRASRNGFSASAFHSYCDGFSGIWVVMKSTTSYIATAYSSVAFDQYAGGGIAATAGTCWLNNLQNPSGTVSSSRFYNTFHPEWSIFGLTDRIPFGGGRDLLLYSPFDTASTSSCFPYTYTGGYAATTLFGMSSGFLMAEIEVYSIV